VTVLVARPAGQLANRLFQYAHVVAAAADHGFTTAFPGLGSDADRFPAFARDALCRYPAPRRPLSPRLRPALARAAPLALRLPRAHDTDAAGALDLDHPSRRPRVIAGWGVRAYGAFERQAGELRRVFAPDDASRAAAEAAVSRARAHAATVVGIHRRRGDYAGWQGGRYFYDDDEYAAVMRGVADLLGDVAFVVCSDEAVPDGAFGDLAVFPGPGAPVPDLTALSLCDRIAGPPSTFSAWASFAGEVPRHEIVDPAAAPTAADFQIKTTG
jgi:hypothetical protein